MARMSDFHVVGDPRFAPDVPSGGGGVSKEYVDNADLNVKKTTAEASNDKYDESVIPSQLTNKLYVFGNPQGMYPAAEIGGDVPPIVQGHVQVGYNYWGQLVPGWYATDVKIYDDTYNRLCVVKTPDPNDTNMWYWQMVGFKDDELLTASQYGNEYPYITIQYSGLETKYYSRTTNTDWELVTDTGVLLTGGGIADVNTASNQYYGCQISGIPIFVLSSNAQSEWDKVNHYISTGDYSGADNYSELYPDNPESYVAIDVISGDWYKVVNNAWVKQGTLELNSSGGGASNLSDLSDVELTNLSNGQILQYNSTSEKWENTDNQGSLPFEFVIDSTDNGINIVYDDSILNGGE